MHTHTHTPHHTTMLRRKMMKMKCWESEAEKIDYPPTSSRKVRMGCGPWKAGDENWEGPYSSGARKTIICSLFLQHTLYFLKNMPLLPLGWRQTISKYFFLIEKKNTTTIVEKNVKKLVRKPEIQLVSKHTKIYSYK